MKDIILNDTNFGKLIKGSIAGKDFWIDKWELDTRLGQTKEKFTFDEEIQPDTFNTNLHLTLFLTPFVEVDFFVNDSLDALELAKAISEIHENCGVVISSCARYLARYLNGEQVGEVRDLRFFYEEVPEDLFIATKLK